MLSVGLRAFPLLSLTHQPSLLGLLWPGVTMSPGRIVPTRLAGSHRNTASTISLADISVSQRRPIGGLSLIYLFLLCSRSSPPYFSQRVVLLPWLHLYL